MNQDKQPEALQAIKALREWVMAVPKDVADALPAMPGIDGDWLDAVEAELAAPQAQDVQINPYKQAIEEISDRGVGTTMKKLLLDRADAIAASAKGGE